MGAFRGSMSYTRFFVRGELPTDVPPAEDGTPRTFRDRFVDAIRLRAFRPLDPNEDVDFRAGWCAPEQPFDTDLAHEKIFFGDYLNLGFRVDRWRIPAPLFKASFRDAERRFLAEHGRDKLSRAQKEELTAVVTATLRKKVVPAMKVIDLSWQLSAGIVRFFHQSPKQHELLLEVFEKTFDLELVQDGAYVAALEGELPAPVLEGMTELEQQIAELEEQKKEKGGE